MQNRPTLFYYLFLSTIAILFDLALVVLSYMGKVPFGLYDFIFVLVIFFTVALYRPREMFWLFVASMPLENIILSPPDFPVSIRPFQAIGGIVVLATLVRWVTGKLDFRLVSFRRICLVCQLIDKAKGKGKSQCGQTEAFGFFDRIVFLLPFSALLSMAFSPFQPVAAKQAVVLFSFVLLYWLIRNYLQSTKEILSAIWFSLIGVKAVVLVALYQAVADKFAWPANEVMSGRVNSTFAEPDWLGMFLALSIAACLWIKIHYQKSKETTMVMNFPLSLIVRVVSTIFIFFLVLVLLLTVARSGWVAAVGVFLVYLVLVVWLDGRSPVKNFKQKAFDRIRVVLSEIAIMVVTLMAAVGLIQHFHLSSFDFSNRASSSLSGEQLITISCRPGRELPEQIGSVEQLEGYGCRHINLEEIETEKSLGNEVKEILRPDPNVSIRQKIYRTTWQKIGERWWIGYGLGSAPFFLGQDERGAGLNSSNIFLESWLSLGLLGFVLIFSLLVFLPLLAFMAVIKRNSVKPAAFVLLTSTAIVLANMFNAGLLIGFFWLWLAVIIPLSKPLLPKKLA